ncbi:MAG: TonB-dependent receptor [Pseudoxanthomonas sp.]
MNRRINALAGAITLAMCGLAGAQAQEVSGDGQEHKAHAETMQSLTPEQQALMQRRMQSMSPKERERMMQRMQSMSPEEHERAMREQIQQMQQVTVTGSLLPGLELENAAPLVVITAEDIQRNGFTSVSDALKAMPFASGSVRDSTPIGGGNAQGTKMVNLFGLGSSFTKVLVNGHPMANFPLTYNTGGGGNFTDLSNIPMVMVDRIEILPGSQSAIYGSDAISGVVNIILKRKIEGVNLGIRLGMYSEGGGGSQRVQLAGGHSWGDTSLIYAVEHRRADPVLATQRALTAKRPYEDDAFAYNNATSAYYDPGIAGCAQMSHLFGGTMTYRQDDDGNPYCGSDYTYSFNTTFDARREQTSGFLSLNHYFSDRLSAYADVGYTLSEASTGTGATYYWDLVPINGQNWRVSREFAPEETGGIDATNVFNRSHQYDIAAGLRGQMGESWDWEAGYSRSYYELKQSTLLPITSSMNNYLRARYQDLSQVFVPLTPAEFASFSARRTRKAETSTDQASFKLASTELFPLPGGAAGLAVLADFGREKWDDQPDARYLSGVFLYGSQQASSGDRDRWGATVQLDMPLHDKLKLTTAGRYDSYSYGGSDVGSKTWRAGLEFRPIQSLLLRGMVGTSFRAADMAFLYAGQTRANSNNNDPYLCDTMGVPRTSPSCRYVMASYTAGNLALEPTTAKSRSLGFVWSPDPNFNLHADYLDIEIMDEVRALTLGNILVDEASCRQGGTAAALPSCDDALARVVRGDNGRVVRVNGGFFNVAYKRMKTIMAGLGYRVPTESFGDFQFNLSGNFIRGFEQQNDAFSPLVDVIANPTGQSALFRSVVNGSIAWDKGPLSATLFAVRYGSTPNFALSVGGRGESQWGTGGYDPAWLLYNASIGYRFDEGVDVSLSANNLFNKMPPSRGWTSYPYYNSQVYNIYGRSLSLEINYRF